MINVKLKTTFIFCIVSFILGALVCGSGLYLATRGTNSELEARLTSLGEQLEEERSRNTTLAETNRQLIEAEQQTRASLEEQRETIDRITESIGRVEDSTGDSLEILRRIWETIEEIENILHD